MGARKFESRREVHFTTEPHRPLEELNSQYEFWFLDRVPTCRYLIILVAVAALAKAYNVSGDLSGIARQGSGSACRSLYGGFVRWRRGEKTDGSDSVAEQVEPPSHWPHLRILILVVSISFDFSLIMKLDISKRNI